MTSPMLDRFSELVADPPADTVDLDAVVRAGQRARRRLLVVKTAGTALAVAGAGAAAITLAPGLASRPTPVAPAASNSAPSPSAPAPTMAADNPDTVAITAQGIAGVVAARLPGLGITERPELATVSQGDLKLARLTVAGPNGTGMFQVSVGVVAVPPEAKAMTGSGIQVVSNLTRPDGSRVLVLANETNCIQSSSVLVYHPTTRTAVQLDNSSCLSYDGKTNPPAARMLTTEQATELATDPALAATVPASVNRAGAEAFPTPVRID